MPYSTTDQHESGKSANRTDGQPRPLHGLKAICAYIGKSENTVIKYIKSSGLPAAKIGGEWVSDEGRIDAWRLSRIG
ncbi:MAG: helix-turn-helix domain-containing protein [Deltaproteobacteria bacterium]|jgi:hypothetical protein|nr:helix-turn-helix domain-containing protein [Deltaproteobacteria bacterium]